jgi:hypothetical protein
MTDETNNNTTATETSTPAATSKPRRTKSATKKTAKAKKSPKAKAKKEAGPRGKVYVIKNEKKIPEKISAQAKFILSHIRRHKGARVADISDAAAKDKKGFPCTQPVKRAVAFYTTKFKKEGILDFAKSA